MNSLGPQWYDVAFSVGPAMTFNELTKLLEVEGFEETAAELHGIICGRLAGGERLHGDKLRNALLASLHSEEELIDNALPSLSRLYQQSLAGLTDPGFAFKPLLPGEETPLAERVEAMAQWTQGFLDGLADSGLSGETLFSDDAANALGDIAAIAQAGFDGDGENEDEVDFAELEEYLRVAAILIFSELASPDDIGPATSTTLH